MNFECIILSMKKALIILISLLILSCELNNKKEEPAKKDGWLFMIYMSGTGTLEQESIINLQSIVDGYSKIDNNTKDSIDIIVLHDRGPGYSTLDNDWTDTRLYKIIDEGKKLIYTADGWRDSEYKEENMGSIETLNKFMNYSISNYPRKNHSLIIWNHGGGLSGQFLPLSRAVSWDTETQENTIESALFINEIGELLKKYYSSDNRLKILGFDACYMGMIEIAWEFRDFVETMVASPNIEIGGWRYSDFISNITNNSTSQQISKDIVSSYKHFSNGYYESNTLTAIDVTKIQPLRAEIELLADKLLSTEKSIIDNILQETIKFPTNQTEEERILYPYIDLGDFLNELNKNNISTTKAINELQNVILSSFAGRDLEPYYGENVSRGLSIFMSESISDYTQQWWYTGENTGTYGQIDFCISDNGSISNWKMLQDDLFKPE